MLALLLAPTDAPAATLTGKVVGVTDGDTLTLLVDKTQYKIRLSRIDAPESRQAFGTRAKQALSGKVFGKTVRVLSEGQDKYGRTLGTVEVDGRNCASIPSRRPLRRRKRKCGKPRPGYGPIRSRYRRGNGGTKRRKLGRGAADPPADGQHWLTESSGVRHNSSCRYYKSSKGRPCGLDEGRACKVCGG